MEHKDRHKGPAGGANQQVEKNNSEIMINDLNTQFSFSESLNNGLKNPKPDNGSDSIFPSSRNVIKHSVNNGESSNGGKNNIKDINVPTAITENDDIENIKKVAAFVKKVLHNDITEKKMEWPLCLLIESKRSVKISQQDFQNMIMEKTAEIMATKSHNGKQMVNMSVCKEQQRSYYKKYKQLLSHVNAMNSKLELLNRLPDPNAKHVRNVGISVDMPEKKKKLNDHHKF